jgi:hypothetical protein
MPRPVRAVNIAAVSTAADMRYLAIFVHLRFRQITHSQCTLALKFLPLPLRSMPLHSHAARLGHRLPPEVNWIITFEEFFS